MDFNSEADCRSEIQGENQHFHVLAVDDSLIDRKLLERLLTVSSYQVTCVESGDKALEYLGLLDMEENEYDTSSSNSSTSSLKSSQQDQVSKVNLIMTDYSMPGITGYDLLKRVKDSTWKDIPVVVMSSENVPSRINMCLEGGAEEFLLKPVQLSDLKKLHSNLLINSVTHSTYDEATIIDDDLSTCSTTTDEMTNSDSNEEDSTTDKNCTNSNKRKAASTTSSSDLSDMRPRVKELPVS